MRSFPCLITFLLASIAMAQPQLENPSFETWDNVGQATQEPQQWSSLKTSDGGAIINGLVPQLCWRSDDARTGQYSVNLRTVSSVIGAANGLLTNGRVHAELDVSNSYMYTVQDNEQWRTAMTSKPDSIVGWFKAAPQAGDRSNVGALLHVDDGRLPAFGSEGNYVAGASWKAPTAAVGEWTRFSAHFQYLNDWQPEWILLILTAGDSAGSQVGTQAWFDDLALIYNVQCLPDAQSVAPGQSFNVGYSTGGLPIGPVTFAAELSDADGSFASPVVIGSVVSIDAAGSIACTMPLGVDAGNGYRVRVTGGSPFYAPVGCDLAIEMETGLSDAAIVVAGVELRGERLIAQAAGPGLLECFAADGHLLFSANLREGLNTIDVGGHSGILLTRVTDSRGTTARRFAVARP